MKGMILKLLLRNVKGMILNYCSVCMSVCLVCLVCLSLSMSVIASKREVSTQIGS